MSNLNIKTTNINGKQYAILIIHRRVTIESRKQRRAIHTKIELVQQIKQHCSNYLQKLLPTMKELDYENINEFLGHRPGYIIDCMEEWKKDNPNRKWRLYFDKDELYLLIRSYIGRDPSSVIWRTKTSGDYISKINNKIDGIKRIDFNRIVYNSGDFVNFQTPGSLIYPELIREVRLTKIDSCFIAKLVYHIPIDRVLVDNDQVKYILYSGSALVPTVSESKTDLDGSVSIVTDPNVLDRMRDLTDKIKSNFVNFSQYKELQYLPSMNITGIYLLFKEVPEISKDVIDSYCQLLNGLVEAQMEYILMRTEILTNFGVKLTPHYRLDYINKKKTRVGKLRQLMTWKAAISGLLLHLTQPTTGVR